MIKLHIGCGLDLKEGYINIDVESKESIIQRYKESENVVFKNYQEKGIEIFNYDIFNLPYDDNTIDEILCNAFLEHISFAEERKYFFEVKRILKPGGILKFGVPDFEWIVKKWLSAKDEWKDFYYTDRGEHYFGQNNRNLDTRWGYMTTAIFGNQNGIGQYHKNAYTRQKIKALLTKIDFEILEINTSFYRGKYEKTLECVAKKKVLSK